MVARRKKKAIKVQAHSLNLQEHRQTTENGTPSASWYATATDYKDIPDIHSLNTQTLKRLRRLRLGYKTRAQIITEIQPAPCEHCNTETSLPLLHYLLKCPATRQLTRIINPPNPDINYNTITPQLTQISLSIIHYQETNKSLKEIYKK